MDDVCNEGDEFRASQIFLKPAPTVHLRYQQAMLAKTITRPLWLTVARSTAEISLLLSAPSLAKLRNYRNLATPPEWYQD